MTEPRHGTGRRTWSVGQAILYGWLGVGIGDALAAAITWGLRGVSPIRVFQGVAAGLLGRQAAVAGGLPTFFLGLACHFFIAFVVAFLYIEASRRLPRLRERALVFGPLYGLVVWGVMTFVVVPLSAIGWTGIALQGALIGIAVHMIVVGLPPALAAARLAPGSGISSTV